MQDLKKEIIIKAAKERFAKYGVKKTSMTEIAADLRMGKATLYYYYTGKDEIYKDVLHYEYKVYKKAIDAIIGAEEKNLREKLKDYLVLRSEIFDKRNNLYNLFRDYYLNPHLFADNPVITEITKAEESFISSLIFEQNKKNKTHHDETKNQSVFILSIIRGFQLVHDFSSENNEKEKLLDLMADFILNSIKKQTEKQ